MFVNVDALRIPILKLSISYQTSYSGFIEELFCGKFKKNYLRNAWEITILLYLLVNPGNNFRLLNQMTMSNVNLQ